MSVTSLRRWRRTTTTHTIHRGIRRMETGTWGSERTDGQKMAPKRTRAKMQSTSCQFQWMAAFSNVLACRGPLKQPNKYKNYKWELRQCLDSHYSFIIYHSIYKNKSYIYFLYLFDILLSVQVNVKTVFLNITIVLFSTSTSILISLEPLIWKCIKKYNIWSFPM